MFTFNEVKIAYGIVTYQLVRKCYRSQSITNMWKVDGECVSDLIGFHLPYISMYEIGLLCTEHETYYILKYTPYRQVSH